LVASTALEMEECPCHDDHFEGRVLALELLEELKAIAVGQDEVDQGQRELALRHLAHGGYAVAGHPDVIALRFEDHPEPLGDSRLVVHQKDARLHGFSHLLIRLAWSRPLCHQGDTLLVIEGFSYPSVS
jgi:hypothetical protein